MRPWRPLVVLWALGLCAPARADTVPPKITHAEVEAAVVGEDLEIVAEIEDESGVFDPTVLYRVGDTGEFLRASMTQKDSVTYVATIPGAFVTDNLGYFIEAYDEMGNGPARFGDAEFPITVTIVKKGALARDADTAGPPTTDSTSDAPAVEQGGPGPPATPEAGPAEEAAGATGTGGFGLWIGVGVAAAIATAVVSAAVIGGGVALYYFSTTGKPDPDPDRITVVVEAGTPVAAFGVAP